MSFRENQLEGQEIKMKEKEEKLKTLVEDEKKRSSMNIQALTKELRADMLRVKEEKIALEQSLEEVKGQEQENRSIKEEFGKNQSLLQNLREENEDLKKKIAELEVKLAQALKTKAFYKSAFENAEVKIQQLTEENNRNKANQILEQKQEIQRLRSELAIAHNKNEEQLVNFATMGTNYPITDRSEFRSNAPLPSASNTSSDASTVIPNVPNIGNKAAEITLSSNDVSFGKHPGNFDAPIGDVDKHISRLEKEREMFLNTKVYNEEDKIIKQLDEKIEMLKVKATEQP